VAQASFQLQQLLHRLQDSPALSLDTEQLKQLAYRLERVKGWLFSLAALAVLLLWNWLLVLSAAAGLLTLVLVYLVQQRQLQMPWPSSWVDWRKLWNRSNRSLTLAVVSGGIATLSVYLVVAIWAESGNSWLTTGLLLQGLGTLAILLLLIWQILNRYFNQQDNHEQLFNQMLTDLADPDPLKRLVATRRITDWANQPDRSLPLASSHLADCFRLMLNRETEPLVCSALLDGLHALNPERQLQGSQAPVISTAVRQARAKTYRQAVGKEEG
jgi:hypothetical protein